MAKTAQEMQKEYLNEKIDYTARRPVGTDERVKEVTVTVNGYNYVIMYNHRVKIPRYVAEVLERAYDESLKIDEKIEEETRESRSIGDF